MIAEIEIKAISSRYRRWCTCFRRFAGAQRFVYFTGPHLSPIAFVCIQAFIVGSAAGRVLRSRSEPTVATRILIDQYRLSIHDGASVDTIRIELSSARLLSRERVCIMKTTASVSMKCASFVAAVLILGMSLPSVLGAPYGWSDGAITYYGGPNGAGTQAGACGYQNTWALGYGAMTAALSSPLFQGGAACGACYQIRCAPVRQTRTVKFWCYNLARSITVTATNLCPPGSNGGWCNPPRHHFDLPMPAFLTLARREGGVASVYYRKVRCAKRGGIRFTIGGNPYFITVLIHNVGGAGDIRAVKIQAGYGRWLSMRRNWGCMWTVQEKLSGPLSFQITTSDGRTLVTRNCVGRGWSFGQTWEGANFR